MGKKATLDDCGDVVISDPKEGRILQGAYPGIDQPAKEDIIRQQIEAELKNNCPGVMAKVKENNQNSCPLPHLRAGVKQVKNRSVSPKSSQKRNRHHEPPATSTDSPAVSHGYALGMPTTAQFRVADTEIGRQFAKDGYYLAKGVFSPEEVKELEADFDRIVTQLKAGEEELNARWSGPEMDRLGAEKMVVLHTHNVQRFSAKWAKALYHERFMKVATDILGPDVMLHHSKLFLKPSEEGAPFPVHQDWTYFPTENDTMMAGIIHVSKATDEMGCLRVYPGSHTLGRVADSSGNVSNEILEKHPLSGATVLEAEPGDVVFFHYFTLHGSMPNRSQEVRKTVLVQMHAGDDQVEEGNRHPNEHLVLAGWNHHASRSSAGAQK